MTTFHEQLGATTRIFYREAGDPVRPTLVLLHGFPSSSHMFGDLMAALEDDFHLIAPDYPGFGESTAPAAGTAPYTFERLADDMDAFITGLGIERFGLYLQDFGAPVGMRIASRHPQRIEALIVQNGNVYEDGLSAAWDGLKQGLWKERNEQTEAPVRARLSSREGVRAAYVAGTRNPNAISPDNWNLDSFALTRPRNLETQLDLLADYHSNVALYPRWHEYLREYQPPTLVAWGKNDAYFTAQGAEAYARDLPDAELHLLDTGHFALEEDTQTIARLVKRFYARRLPLAPHRA